MNRELTQRIVESVNAGFERQVEATAELVARPSLRGAEQAAQSFVAREMEALGLAVRLCKIDRQDNGSPDDAANVVGVHRARQVRGRSLILNGHVDVVPPGPLDMWTSPPFEPRVADGWLYGRGAGDMKAGLMAAVYALKALQRIGLQPAADLYLQSVVEEECTGNGTLACLQDAYRADVALILEPMDACLTRAQVGVIWFQVKVRGFPVHVGKAAQGSNAIESSFHLIQALHGLAERWNRERRRHRHFEHIEHPLFMNVGSIVGGDWPSSVPAWCTFEVRLAFYPGMGLSQVRQEIEACIQASARGLPFLDKTPPEITYTGFQAEGYVLTGAEAAESMLSAAHRTAFQRPLKTVTSTATTDARFFGLYAGIPGMVYGPVAENIHGFDERVDLDSVRRITRAVGIFIASWCGLEPLA